MRRHLGLLMMAVLVMGTVSTAWSQGGRGPRDRGPREPGPRFDESTLTVSGQGEVAAEPDRATVRLGAEAQAATAQAAQSQVNEVMQRALQRIRAAGIEERAIQTTGLRLSPVYERQRPGDDDAPRIVAYRASNTVRVAVDDLRRVGNVIDAGVTAGANQLQGIDFELQNDLSARTQALQKAVAEARAKAEALAGALDVRLLEIAEVQEGGVNIVPPRPVGDMMVSAKSFATPVQPGEVQVQASVAIRYRIAPR